MSGGRAIVTAVAIGIAFGWALERAGLGSARKLTGQFYLRDFTVLKVMFTAIVTAMLGVFWLGRLGVLDLSLIYVPETYLLPQLAGGLIFGAGLLLAGLCPGTSCVAAATGRGDGVAVVAGLLSGVLVTGLAFQPLEALYQSSSRGVFTLPELFGLSHGALVLAVTFVALAAFAIIDRPSTRYTRSGQVLSTRALAVLALGAAALAAVAGNPKPPAQEKSAPDAAIQRTETPIRRRGC